MENIWIIAEKLFRPVGLIVGAIIVGLVVHYVSFAVLVRIADRTRTNLDSFLVRHIRRPMRLIVPLIFVHLITPFLDLSGSGLEVFGHVLSLVVIVSVSWLLLHIMFTAEDVIMDQFDISERDNLKARKVYTQIQVFKRVSTVIIGILTLGAMLMTFDKVRQLGTSILASAGIVGIIVGFAAQRTLGTILAGIQIAVTQPIRIDDVVVVEGEWGRIEEITFTYVVVRIWDLRRLVLPVSYFLEKPFENWTRVSANILGTVFLYTDYTIPVEAVREEFQRILKSSDKWDGEVWNLVVTNASEKTVELRALMSARDSGTAWDLRCEVREKLVSFIREKYPDSLPRLRAELEKQVPDKTED